jgi:protein-ribulosamine 3-kinase
MFAAEFEGLLALRGAGIRAPEPFAHGVRGGRAFIEMEHLALGGAPDWPALGRMLARLHRATGERFGWASDNWIGLSPQANGWSDDWAAFFLEKRLQPQAARAGLLDDLPDLAGILAGHRPAPSLLHGDLWSGNVGFTPQGPVMFDPAVYYGDREADLAMTELFGGFPPAFHDAYSDCFPLSPGYEKRRMLYNLYHLLNHLNLFGAAWRPRVTQALRFLREAL